MFEKVSPAHPDKLADRLSGAIVDLVYERAGGLTKANPRVACEVMAGHGRVDVQIETSLGRMDLRAEDIDALIHRIFGERVTGNVLIAPQDEHLSENQTHGLLCGDNGIFKGCPVTHEQKLLTAIAATMWERFGSDGKYVVANGTAEYESLEHGVYGNCIMPNGFDLTICQSHAETAAIKNCVGKFFNEQGGYSIDHNEGLLCIMRRSRLKNIPYERGFRCIINPLGPWTGGIDVDCGCTNRKLGSDMGDGVTGGGLMGKDLSKADVSVNIVCFLKAVASGQVVTAVCSIGDESVTFTYADGHTETEPFADIVEQARLYILTDCGGSFERFAEWGLIRPTTDCTD